MFRYVFRESNKWYYMTSTLCVKWLPPWPFLNLSASHFRKEGGFWFKGHGHSGLLTSQVGKKRSAVPAGVLPSTEEGSETQSGGIVNLFALARSLTFHEVERQSRD